MKTFSLILNLILLFTISILGQTKVDEYYSIQIPGEVMKLDTLIQNIPILFFISSNETESFLVGRVTFDSKEKELNDLPYDLKSLRRAYHHVINGQLKSMKEAGYSFQDSTEIKIDNYIGYKIRYNDPETGIQNAESNIILLNENFYVSTYMDTTDFNETNKNIFLNSIKIDSSKEPHQMIGKSPTEKRFYILGEIFFYVLLIVGIIFFIKKIRKK